MDTYLMEDAVRSMQCFDFDWYFYQGDRQQPPGEQSVEGYRKVQLPHDWSLFYPFDDAGYLPLMKKQHPKGLEDMSKPELAGTGNYSVWERCRKRRSGYLSGSTELIC